MFIEISVIMAFAEIYIAPRLIIIKILSTEASSTLLIVTHYSEYQ